MTASSAPAPSATASSTTPPASSAAAEAPPPEPTRPFFQLGISLRGHATFDGKLIGAGSAVIDAGLSSGLGGLIDAGLESSRTTTIIALGSVSAWLSFASLFIRYAFPLGAWTFTPAAGARLFFVSAQASGFTTVEPRLVRVSPAGVLALEVRRTLFRGLFLSGSLAAYLRQPQTLKIEGFGPVDEIGELGASVALGLGWDLF